MSKNQLTDQFINLKSDISTKTQCKYGTVPACGARRVTRGRDLELYENKSQHPDVHGLFNDLQIIKKINHY